MQHLKYCVALIAAVSVLSLTAPDGVCGERDHENGFFLRLALGGGPAKSRIESGPEFLEFSGTGLDIEIAVGGIVAPNLAVHGTVFGWLISDPDLKSDYGSVQAKGDLNLSALGAGLTYYFMPINIYLSGTVGFGQLSGDGDIDGSTDTGLILEAVAGKEWFVSNRWGLGVAVGFTYHSLPEPDIDPNWKGWSIPIRFSATFN